MRPSSDPPPGDTLTAVREALARAQRVLFITGAGLSADSGLPTYRGTGGLYDVDTTRDGVPIEEALSGPMFRRNPALTWRYLREIEQACRGALPNAGHQAIAALEGRMAVSVLTQNVDGLHGDAGSTYVIEIHGNLRELHCTVCDWVKRVRDYQNLALRCPHCGSGIRPRVVLFEERLPMEASRRLEMVFRQTWDIVFSVGTTSVFPYIAAPVQRAAAAGRMTVEINPGTTSVSGMCRHRIRTGAAEALRGLVDEG